MTKQKQDEHVEVEREYPLQILYSSPPEAATLNQWVQEVENKRSQGVDSKPRDGE